MKPSQISPQKTTGRRNSWGITVIDISIKDDILMADFKEGSASPPDYNPIPLLHLAPSTMPNYIPVTSPALTSATIPNHVPVASLTPSPATIPNHVPVASPVPVLLSQILFLLHCHPPDTSRITVPTLSPFASSAPDPATSQLPVALPATATVSCKSLIVKRERGRRSVQKKYNERKTHLEAEQGYVSVDNGRRPPKSLVLHLL